MSTFTSIPPAPFFLSSIFERPPQIPNDIFTKSLETSQKQHSINHPLPTEECTHPFVQSWNLSLCDHCSVDLGTTRREKEEMAAQVAAAEDEEHIASRPHDEMLHSYGISVLALLAFTFDHDCWDWPTYQVVRDIIKPATQERRCRYANLPGLEPFFGPARCFISHCWSARWGDLVGAACQGSRSDRNVWIDIFAVRQWPGNQADLNFRGVISRSNALIVSVSFDICMEELGTFLEFDEDRLAFFLTPNGKRTKKILAFFRLWCVVELAAACASNVPVVIKGGKCQLVTTVIKDGGIIAKKTEGITQYSYDVEKYSDDLLINLKNAVDVNHSECTVQSDKVRELKYVSKLKGGIDEVNRVTKGVLVGASSSVRFKLHELDAAVCGEEESFKSTNRLLLIFIYIYIYIYIFFRLHFYFKKLYLKYYI